jgi:hypothetical protein
MTNTSKGAPAGYAPDSEVARFFGVHPKTLPRWDRQPELDFPRPLYILGRKYRSWSEIHAFTRRAAAEHASQRTPKPHHEEEETQRRPPI